MDTPDELDPSKPDAPLHHSQSPLSGRILGIQGTEPTPLDIPCAGSTGGSGGQSTIVYSRSRYERTRTHPSKLFPIVVQLKAVFCIDLRNLGFGGLTRPVVISRVSHGCPL